MPFNNLCLWSTDPSYDDKEQIDKNIILTVPQWDQVIQVQRKESFNVLVVQSWQTFWMRDNANMNKRIDRY